MLPLIPLILSIAPEIAAWAFGSKGEAVTSAAVQAVEAITGTTDAAAAQAVVARDPDKAAALRIELAKIAAAAEQAARQADLDTLRAQLADVANARGQQTTLASTGSGVAWAPAAVSLVVLVSFGGVLFLAMTRSLPPGSEAILNIVIGTLAGMATAVIQFWIGSSVGSERKTDLLYRSKPAE